MLTALVALTLIPQQGQTYFLVLLFLPPAVPVIVPLCVPVPVMWKLGCSFLFSRMSVKPFSITKSNSSSVGSVSVHP